MLRYWNKWVRVEEWQRGSGFTMKDMNKWTSFWLRIDPPKPGELSMLQEIPPWEKAYCCHLPREGIVQTMAAQLGGVSWTTNVGSQLLYEDALVNVWDFQVQPGMRCLYHVHRFPYLFINLTDVMTRPVDVNGCLVPHETPRRHIPGEITFVDVKDGELPHHAFQNVSLDSTLCQYILEFKSPPS